MINLVYLKMCKLLWF